MILQNYLCLFVAMLSASFASLSSCRDRSVSTDGTLKLVGGRDATEVEYPEVLIWTTHDADLKSSYCTGTKIASDKILTAAHCVLTQDDPDEDVQTEDSVQASQLRYHGQWHYRSDIGVGSLIQYASDRKLSDLTEPKFLVVRKTHLYPDVERCIVGSLSDLSCTGRVPSPDIAIIEVEPETDSAFSKMPTGILDYETVLPSEQIVIMGYGATDDPVDAGDDDSSSQVEYPRLKVHNSVVAEEVDLRKALQGTDAEVYGFPSLNVFFGALGILLGPQYANLGSGDSGGPVMRLRGGNAFVVGINTDGYCPLTFPDCQRTTNSFFLRLDSEGEFDVAAWLQEILKPQVLR